MFNFKMKSNCYQLLSNCYDTNLEMSTYSASKTKIVLITGCDSGFGYSLACHVPEKHPTFLLIACCFSMQSEGAKDLIANGVTVFNLDVTDVDSIEKLRQDVEKLLDEKNGELWTIVNNAATLVFADAILQTR